MVECAASRPSSSTYWGRAGLGLDVALRPGRVCLAPLGWSAQVSALCHFQKRDHERMVLAVELPF